MKKLLVSLITVGCLQFVAPLYAQVSGIINYQGRVVVGGTNFDGTGLFQFALMGGIGATNYWSNDGTAVGQPSISVSLPVTKGLYSVLLGDTTVANMTTTISPTVFANSNVWLRVWFNDGVHGFEQLSPDQRVAAVGYAMMAGTVPAGAITSAQLASNAVTAANLAPGAVTAAAIASNAVTGTGCYIVRGATTLNFGNNITAWASAIQNSDMGYVIGGNYVLTNVVFEWAGKAGVTVVAESPYISDVFTSNTPTTMVFPCMFDFQSTTNVTCLGDWNAREIVSPDNITNGVLTHIYFLNSGHNTVNLTVDGMHGQLEVQACFPGAIFLPCAAGGNVISNVVYRNCKFGYLNAYQGGETDVTTHGASILAVHDNGSYAALTLNNDIFYGYHFKALGANNPVSSLVKIFNCWTLDNFGYSYVGGTGGDGLSATMGTFETNENLSYFLPGSPMPQMQVATNAIKRVPPDWNTPYLIASSASIPSAETNWIVIYKGITNYFNTRLTP